MSERKYSARARQSNVSPPTARPCSAVENVEFVENATQHNADSDSISTFSTLSTPTLDLSAAIIPVGSWLERYLDYARKREESADCYFVGSILPVVSITLARRVWFPWGDGRVAKPIVAALIGSGVESVIAFGFHGFIDQEAEAFGQGVLVAVQKELQDGVDDVSLISVGRIFVHFCCE